METENDGVELGVLTELVGYHLRRASSAFGGDFSRALSGTGMRQVLFGILSVVDANPGINQGAAGRVLGIQRANMVALINELVDDGWIERKVAAEDRRAFALTMTAAGKAKLGECLALIRAHEEEMLGDLTAADRNRLIALLSKIEAKER
ncbi:MAG: MarR family transcriptional regulator [Sphingomonas sp.]|nr:MarR family transcriptional regulator [Sphingomonas sp.]